MTNLESKNHYKAQLKRSKEYKKLLGMSIPDRASDKKKIVDALWYIVWEKNLLKPKIFKYSFVSDIFAINFGNKHLMGKPFYIIKGKDLKAFGVLKVDIGLRYTGKKTIGTLPHKYDFPEGISMQRKKTLRTMYRRNLRRLLLKLLKNKRNKMADKFVKDKIDEKPAAFFKKLKKQWFYELTYSVTFKEWYVREESWRIDEITQAAKFYPKYASEISNILIILETQYSDEKYDYRNETYVSLAVYLWETYKDRINKYMKKKGYTPRVAIHNIEESWRELVYRGFIPYNLLPLKFNPKTDYYIRCMTSGMDLVYPKKADTQTGAFDMQLKFGVTGFTGVNQPNLK